MIAGAISMPTMADFLGVYAGIDYQTTTTEHTRNGDAGEFDDTNNFSGYITFEHFIPAIPNAKLKYSDLSSDTDTTKIDSSATNAILYYQLLDNSLLEFDLGLAYTDLETDHRNLDTELAQAYAAAKLHIPGTGMHAFTEVIAGSVTDDDASDAQIGLSYNFNPDSLLLNVSVRAGYRYQDATIDNFKQESKGPFAGLEVHF